MTCRPGPVVAMSVVSVLFVSVVEFKASGSEGDRIVPGGDVFKERRVALFLKLSCNIDVEGNFKEAMCSDTCSHTVHCFG